MESTTSHTGAFFKSSLAFATLLPLLSVLYVVHYYFVRRLSCKPFLPKGSLVSSNFSSIDALLNSPGTLDISIIIPAFNEERRLPGMLDKTIPFFHAKYGSNFEIIVVSDGSSDGTVSYLQKTSEKHPEVHYIHLAQNKGKGFAVKVGIHFSRGKRILFADADGATSLDCFDRLNNSLSCHLSQSKESDMVAAFGSRAHLADSEEVKRKLFRVFLMKCFHFVVWSVIGNRVKDTQCGFKLFTRSAARQIFPQLHINRWAFDVEMLYIAKKLNIPVDEVYVDWREVEGSKLNIASDSVQMLRDLMFIRLCYLGGLWNVSPIV
ncbi:hypothetical protein GEMRC1_003313 [Eukaryota sp. GEM-RC1]